MAGREVAVFWTIAAAVVCWALGEALRSRAWWTAGALLACIHSLAAFGVFYGWSHETARVMTTRQTAALTGVQFDGGIFVNYLFLAVWAADACWSWMRASSYERRPAVVSMAIRGFLFFIIVNGAIVFADGWARVVGMASVSVVLVTWLRTRSSRHGASITAG